MAVKKCEKCRKHPVTVNYVRSGKTYYRKTCYYCIKAARIQAENTKTLIKRNNYKKKEVCDRCGFRARVPEQMEIYYRDGNPANASVTNLRTHCANCSAEIRANPKAGRGDLLADF